MPKNTWTPERETLLAARLKEGKTLLEISNELGIHNTAISKRAKKLGLNTTSKVIKKWTKEEEEYLRENYVELTRPELAKGLDRTLMSVNRKMSEMKLPLINKQAIRDKMTKYNHVLDFFSDKSIISSYVAGVLATDGCVHESSKSCSNKRLSLGLSDRDFLERVTRYYTDTPVSVASKAGTMKALDSDKIYNKKEHYKVSISNCDPILKDLEEFYGITERKTHTLTFPYILPYENILAYLIGCVDGDGWISSTKGVGRTNEKYTVYICGASKEWMDKAKDFLETYFEIPFPAIRFHKTTYVLTINRKDVQKCFLSFIAENSLPVLERKWGRLKWHDDEEVIPEGINIFDPIVPSSFKYGLINVTRAEYEEKKELLISMVSEKRRVFARNTEVKEVETSVYREFTERNHIEGFVGAEKKLGLYENDSLVAVASFSPLSKEENTYELKRFCTERGVQVIGGLSKLIKNSGLKGTLVSFSDERYSMGKVYDSLGFKYISRTDGLYFYDGKILHGRHPFMKHKLVEKHGFPTSMTAREMAKELGYTQLTIGGNKKWVKNL